MVRDAAPLGGFCLPQPALAVGTLGVGSAPPVPPCALLGGCPPLPFGIGVVGSALVGSAAADPPAASMSGTTSGVALGSVAADGGACSAEGALAPEYGGGGAPPSVDSAEQAASTNTNAESRR